MREPISSVNQCPSPKGATNSFPSELLRTLECNIPKCDQVPGRVSVSCLHTPHRNSPMKTCQSSWYKAYFSLEHSHCYNFILNLVWIENVQLSFATSFCSKMEIGYGNTKPLSKSGDTYIVKEHSEADRIWNLEFIDPNQGPWRTWHIIFMIHERQYNWYKHQQKYTLCMTTHNAVHVTLINNHLIICNPTTEMIFSQYSLIIQWQYTTP